MKELRIGLVGLGNRGLNGWIPTFKAVKGAKVAAVCDKLQALVDQGVQKTGDPEVKGFVDVERMLRETDIDAVGIVVEPENQPELILRSLEAGKHVVCEVPLTFKLDECRRIVKAVNQRRQPVVNVYRAAHISAIGICAGRSAEQNGIPVEVPDFRTEK